LKASITIDKSLNIQEMKDIAIKLNEGLGITEDNMRWGQVTKNGLNQVYSQSDKDDMNMSVIIENNSKENKGESYIIVDINENKVYKNIVGNYARLQKSLESYSNKVDIYTCLIGEYDNKISLNKSNNIIKNILNNLNAKEIERIEDDNFISITSYSRDLNGTKIEYLGRKVNLNIGMRYSEYDQKTLIYVATPLIRLDY